MSGIAVDGGALLLVAGGGDRDLHVVRRLDLRDGGVVEARAVPFSVRREARLGGTEEMAGRGFELGDLWGQPVDLQGLAVHGPDVVCVLERTYRVVYTGLLSRDAEGLPSAARLERAFVVPGGERPGTGRSDWRDASEGLVGLTAAVRGRSQDLLALARSGTALWSTDRFGQMPQRARVHLAGGFEVEVGDLAFDRGDVLVVRGSGRGTMERLRPVGDAFVGTSGAEEEGPAVEGAGPWRSLALAPDGALFLASSGDPCFVAWRAAASRGVPPAPPPGPARPPLLPPPWR